MNSRINLIFLNEEGIVKEENTIECPKSYSSLIMIITKTKIRKNFQLFTFNSNDEKKIISNEKDFIENKSYIDFYIQEVNEDYDEEEELAQSSFSLVYSQLPENEQEIFDEKYCCSIGYERIKNENPYFCYQCQNIICKNHLILENGKRKPLTCPSCKYEMPLEKWKVLKNFDQNVKNEVEMVANINKLKKEITIKNEIINAKDQKIEDEKKEKEKYKKENESLLKKIEELMNKIKALQTQLADNEKKQDLMIEKTKKMLENEIKKNIVNDNEKIINIERNK